MKMFKRGQADFLLIPHGAGHDADRCIFVPMLQNDLLGSLQLGGSALAFGIVKDNDEICKSCGIQAFFNHVPGRQQVA